MAIVFQGFNPKQLIVQGVFLSVKKQGSRLRHHKSWFLLPILAALLATAALFRAGISRYWGPADSDLVNQFYPWHVFIHRWFARGIWPWWDPHVFSGYPTLETQQMLALNPIHLLSLLLPAPVGLPLQMALHTAVASVGTAWALHRWGRQTRAAAAMAGCAWALGGLFAVRVMAGHFTVVAGIAWWPLALLSVLRLVRRIPSPPAAATKTLLLKALPFTWQQIRSAPTARLIATAALFHALIALAGGPQYLAYLFYMDAALVLAVARPRAWLVAGLCLGVVWSAALLLSAPQWLPALWYLPFSARSAGVSTAGGLELGPLLNLSLEALMPFPFGDDLTQGHLHFKNVWETATYPGTAVLVFAVASLVRIAVWLPGRIRRRGRLRPGIDPVSLAGAALLVLGFYMMIGGWLPGFASFREATKARAVMAFGVVLLASTALSSLGRLFTTHRRADFTAILLLGAALSGAAGYGQLQSFEHLVKSFGPPFDPQASATYLEFLGNPARAAGHYLQALYWSFAVLAISATAIGLLRRRPAPALLLLVTVSVADPAAAHLRAWWARHPWEQATIPAATEKFFRPLLAESEAARDLPWRAVLHSAIINRTHHIDGLYEYHGYDPLMPAQAVGRLLMKGVTQLPEAQRLAYKPTQLENVGVRYDTAQWLPETAAEAPATSQVLTIPSAALYELTRNVTTGSPGPSVFGPDTSGTTYLLPGVSGAEDLKEPISASPEFTQMVNQSLGATHPSDLSPADKLTPLPQQGPNAWGVRTELSAPAVLLWKTTWLPGWSVAIDGGPAQRALLANNWMCAAIVPVGQHNVLFTYHPVGWWPALVLTAAGAVIILLFAVQKRR